MKRSLCTVGESPDINGRITWNTAPARVALSSQDTHVWIANLDCHESIRDSFWTTLSHPERERASRFGLGHLRQRFITAHGILRDILSRYIGVGPECLQFETDVYGKPSLVGAGQAEALKFNLSHSEERAACAVARNRRIGVDVERLREIPERESIAAHYFTRGEQGIINNFVTADEKNRAFLTCWTRKEAYIKAIGRGLSIPLPSFDTSLPPRVRGRFLNSVDDPLTGPNWWLTDLPSVPNCAGALVIEQGAENYAFWRWSPRCAADF